MKSLLYAAGALLLAGAIPFSEEKPFTKAVCVIHPTKGNAVGGRVVFTAKEGGVLHIQGELTGLTPGKHGFHIHEFGDLDCEDGKCTGGHFNPDGSKHGAPGAAIRHAGDLGNIEADASGKAAISMDDKMISLNGAHSIIGRAIIVHAKEDDMKTDPTGNAGDRIGYGVIGIGKP